MTRRRNHTIRHRPKKSNSAPFTRSKPGRKNALRQLKRSVKRSRVRRRGGIDNPDTRLNESAQTFFINILISLNSTGIPDNQSVLKLSVSSIFGVILQNKFTQNLYNSCYEKATGQKKTALGTLHKTILTLIQEFKRVIFENTEWNYVKKYIRNHTTSEGYDGVQILHTELLELLQLPNVDFGENEKKKVRACMYVLWNYSDRLQLLPKEHLLFKITDTDTSETTFYKLYYETVYYKIKVYTDNTSLLFRR